MRATSPSRSRVAARYVALGDSFTAGAAGSDERSFADHLAELMREVNPALDYRNVAVPGARTQEIVTGQLAHALAVAPDVVTLVCGGNDALLSVRPDVHAHVDAFERAVAMVSTHLPDTAFVTATTPDPARFLPLRPRSARRISLAIERINEATAAAAARAGVPCLDFASSPEVHVRDNYAADGYHPSGSAARLAAEAFADVLGVRYGIEFDREDVL